MSVVTLNINNKQFKIACPDGKELDIENSALKISEMVNQLKLSSPSASTEYLLLLVALSLRYELDTANNIVSYKNDSESVNDMLNSMNDLSSYLESLAKKIQ